MLLRKDIGKVSMLRRIQSAFKVSLLAGAIVLAHGATQLSVAGEIAASVNNGVITKYQVQQRARFLNVVGGVKKNSKEQAMKELIEEELQMQEAGRLNFSIPDNAVDRAYANIAKRATGGRLNASQFSKALRQAGINPSTLKERLKAQITWAEIVRGRSRQESQPQRRNDITAILFNHGSDSKNRKVTEYTLEQFVFVVQRDASKKLVKQRIREAETFRQTYKSCEDAGERAKAINNLVVTKLGRFTADTLPPNIKDEVLETKVGNFTKPKKGELGIGMMAVCRQRQIVDNSKTQADQFSANALTGEALQENSKQWMQELRDLANIQQR